MKITRVSAEFLNQPLGQGFRPTWNPGVVQDSVYLTLVRVETDAGITGIGAGPCSSPAIAPLVGDHANRHLVGLDPFRVEEVSRRMQPLANEYVWPWCVEMAIWDALGQATGQPVYKLLGGYHEALPAYASLAERRDAATRVEDVHRLRTEGFRAVKLRFRHDDVREDIKVVEAVRAAHGGDVTLMVDANQGSVMPGSQRYRVWDLKTALYVADALAALEVAWLEEPLPRRNFRELRELTRLARLPIAGGELNHHLTDFTLLVQERCYDIIQADAAFSEGLWNCRKVAGMAEAFGLPFVPHTWSSGIGLRANLHLALACPNCTWFEVPYDPPTFLPAGRDRLLTAPLMIGADGLARPDDRPGLGFALDEDFVAHLRQQARA